MKFSTMCVFMVLWGTFVYCPIAHWVWSDYALAVRMEQICESSRAFDFAGGTVVHISSGVSALVCALLIGKRLGVRPGANAASQPDVHLHRGGPAVGRLVRLQCR